MNPTISNFNTSHVKVYPSSIINSNVGMAISIHLMLKFISGKGVQFNIFNNISIHLMLKFIHIQVQSPFSALDFNTSHVKVYRICLTPCCVNKFYFNTSHVKVYLDCSHRYAVRCMISIHLMLKFIQRISCISYNPLYQISQYLSTF